MDDIRFALRQFRKAPAFTVTAVLTLALGICASVAIFAFVDAALLQPLRYPHSDRLAGVFESVQMFPRSNLSYFDYLDWKRLNTEYAGQLGVDAPDWPGSLTRTRSPSTSARQANAEYGTRMRKSTRQTATPSKTVGPTT